MSDDVQQGGHKLVRDEDWKASVDYWQAYALLLARHGFETERDQRGGVHIVGAYRRPQGSEVRFMGSRPCSTCGGKTPAGIPSHVPRSYWRCRECVWANDAVEALDQYLQRFLPPPKDEELGFAAALERASAVVGKQRVKTGPHQARRTA